MRQIALYGKGGIGKSTVASHLLDCCGQPARWKKLKAVITARAHTALASQTKGGERMKAQF